MQIIINNLPPMPRNRSHTLTVAGKRPISYKTPLCVAFEKDLEERLEVYKKSFWDFHQAFKPEESFIELTMYAFCPSSELFTQKGTINSKCPDFDSNKVMIDVLARCLGVDDKYYKWANIKYFESHSGFWDYVISFNIRSLSELKVGALV
jgi:hypothetical protein